jgi:peptidoglycan/xylan/chitin deacetylase (PgdA/CDA1 family)
MLERLRWPDRLLLCFHAVDETWPDPSLSVPPGRFGSFLGQLEEAGYRGTTFAAAVAAPPGERVVAITFDDAYTSVSRVAAPMLASLGWPGTVFVPTQPMLDRTWMEWLGSDIYAAHPVATAQLTPDDLRGLVQQGWEVGSHGRTHRLLSRLDDGELEEELSSSREELAALAGSCVSISYPWGEVDARVVDAARRAGYTAGSGLAGSYSWRDPLRAPRALIAGSDTATRFALKASRPLWAVRSTPLWDLAEAVRGLKGARDEETTSPLRRSVDRLKGLSR